MIFKVEPTSIRSVWQGYERKAFPAGATIFAGGETGSAAFILLRGDVTLHAGREAGRERGRAHCLKGLPASPADLERLVRQGSQSAACCELTASIYLIAHFR
jgi:hypothetical protein